ncbi:MAG: hypothetical protein QOH25_3009 [Acidobacteriota bacterium]|nr:hypothetical protein [Acidobacteriota bacterium]
MKDKNACNGRESESFRTGFLFVAELMKVVAAAICLVMSCSMMQAQTPPAAGQNNSTQTPKKSNVRPVNPPAPQPEPFDSATVEKMAGQCVRLETEAGVIELEMLAEAAPENVRNFLNLVAIGAYDTTLFSRVVKDFVVQGGNLSTGQKWSLELAKRAARKTPDEPSYVKHVRGIVSMARPDEPNSATTHFFILVGEAAQLDGKFSAFGRVTRGMDVVDAINKAETEGDKPVKPFRLTRAVVEQCGKKQETEDRRQKSEYRAESRFF